MNHRVNQSILNKAKPPSSYSASSLNRNSQTNIATYASSKSNENHFPNEQVSNMMKEFEGLKQSVSEVKTLISELLSSDKRTKSKTLLLFDEFMLQNDQTPLLKEMIKKAAENRWPDLIKVDFKELYVLK
jgi:hypothetical protein